MTRGQKTTTYVSVCLSFDEKAILDAAAKEAGQTRYRWIRNWIATLTPKS